MNIQRILGIILVVAGLGLFFIGMNSSNSWADQISNTFTGRFTDRTNWYILGGIITAVAGVTIGLLGPRGKNA